MARATLDLFGDAVAAMGTNTSHGTGKRIEVWWRSRFQNCRFVY